ncbi:MAG: EAL domain-containing protein [bacterium]
MTLISGIQEAELRQAFIKHLPKRMLRLRNRCLRLCYEGWDINVVSIAHREAAQLAGLTGQAGQIEESDVAHQLELFLEPLLKEERLPSDAEIADLDKLASHLVEDEAEQVVPAVTEVEAGCVAASDDLDHSYIEVVEDEYNVGSVQDEDVFDSVLPTSAHELTGRKRSEQNQNESLQEQLLRYPRIPGPVLAPNPDALILQLMQSGKQLDANIKQHKQDLSLEDELIALEKAAKQNQDELSEDAEVDESFVVDFDSIHVENDLSSDVADVPEAQAETEREIEVEPGEEVVSPVKGAESASRIYILKGESQDLVEFVGLLDSSRYQLEEIHDLDEMLELITALVPDAIIVDSDFLAQIEQLGEVVRKIRSSQNISLPFIAFSESKEITDRLTAMRAGTNAYFVHPVDVTMVKEQLDGLLQSGMDDPYRILIVDDDRSQAKFAESILEKSGMQPSVVLNALEVLDEMEKTEPDLVLMDLYMPECNGMELTAMIREREQFLSTPIVFLSGEQDEDKQFDALNMGGDDFLAKPIRPKHLIAAVQNRVRRARAQAQKIVAKRPTQDMVTGLFQRAELFDRLNAAIAGEDKSKAALMILRLESPATIRNQIGYQSFESLLNSIGATVTQSLDSSSVVARFGENSLGILLPETNRQELEETCQLLIDEVSQQMYEIDDHTLKVGLMVGAVAIQDMPADASMIIATTESVCEKVLSNSTQKYEIYAPPDKPKGEMDDNDINNWIKEGLESNDLQVLYQPIMSLLDTECEQYQTLLRLTTSEGMVLPAARLIPVAEKSDLILEIDRWVINHAMMVVSRRDTAGKPVQLFVSQSAKGIREEGKASLIGQKLHARSIEKGSLILDYRLPQIASQLRWAKKYFAEVQKEGALICLSQFDGSSMAMQLLKHLEVNYLKLTPAAISGSVGAMDLPTLIEQAHEANIKVIAPMIEDAQSAAKLWTSGIDFIQGNFVQKPDQHMSFDFSGSAF